MFSEPRRNFIQSDEGFSVQVIGRSSIRYEDGDGPIIISSEFLLGEPSIRILLCAAVRLEATGSNELLPMARRRAIGENIRRAFASTGHDADVVYTTSP